MSRTRSAVKQFRAQVAAEFAFLVEEFGFQTHREPLTDEFRVMVVNGTTRILVEGINWGGSVRVAFGSAGPLKAFEDFDLLDLVSIRCPDRTPAKPVNQLDH